MNQSFPSQMVLLEKQGQYAQMLVAARHLAEVAPRDALAPFYAGQAHFWNGDFNAASAQWKQAVALDPQLKSQVGPLQGQLARIRRAYPTLQLRPVQLAPSEVQAHKTALVKRALSLLNARRAQELDAWSEQLEKSHSAGQDGLSDSFVVSATLASPQSNSEAVWDERQKLLESWDGALPASRYAKLALFRFWTNRAWKERGDGFASEVTPPSWKKMKQRLGQASQVAARLPASAQKTPLFWADTIRFSMLAGLSPSDVRSLGAEAIQHFPGDRCVDCAIGFALLPQWTGEPGEWQRFFTARADAIGGEAGDIAYAQMVVQQMEFFEEKTFWQRTGAHWPRARRGFQALLRRQPNSVSLATWLLLQARLNHDAATARAMVLRLNNRANANKWNSPRDFSLLRLAVLDPANR